MEVLKCKICNLQCSNSQGFGMHIRRKHDIEPLEYYNKYILVDMSKIPKCSCGDNSKFYSILMGYAKYCEKGINCVTFNSGKNNPMYGVERTKDWRENHSKFVVDWFKEDESRKDVIRKNGVERKGISIKFSESHLENIRKHLKNINNKGLNLKGGKTKWYEIENIKTQGRWEYAFIFDLVERNKKLPKRGKPIKTPYGWYTPDFEFEEEFLEIKSSYTFKTSMRGKQRNKIMWVRENIKKVRIKILSEDFVKDKIIRDGKIKW